MKKRTCPLCLEEMDDPPAIHDVVLCEKTELLKGRIEIKKLTAAVKYWKDAWYEGREIIGKLWWHHPAIASDESRVYYQANLKALGNKQ